MVLHEEERKASWKKRTTGSSVLYLLRSVFKSIVREKLHKTNVVKSIVYS